MSILGFLHDYFGVHRRSLSGFFGGFLDWYLVEEEMLGRSGYLVISWKFLVENLVDVWTW